MMRTGSLARGYLRWHFPVGCALLLALSLVAFQNNLVSDIAQPSNSNPAMVIHGLFLLAWMILLLVQSLLPRLGRIDLHRRFGPYVFAIAAGVVISTLWLFAEVWRGWAAVSPEVLANRILLPAYAACILAAYRMRRRADWHKRLVYCGTLLLSEPVLARTFDPLVARFLPLMAPGEDMPIFLSYLFGLWAAFFLALALYDLLSRRRVHPVTLASFAGVGATYAIAFSLAPAGA
jgi:hypothetical protein